MSLGILDKNLSLTFDADELIGRDLSNFFDLNGVRSRCNELFGHIANGKSAMIQVNGLAVNKVAKQIARSMSCSIEHSTVYRFNGVNKLKVSNRLIVGDYLDTIREPLKRLRTHLEIATLFSLLNISRTGNWTYEDKLSGEKFTGAEGVALAFFRAYQTGVFGGTHDGIANVNYKAIRKIDRKAFADILQLSPSNRLDAANGRFSLLGRLGEAMEKHREVFEIDGDSSLGLLADFCISISSYRKLPVNSVFKIVLYAFQNVWTGKHIMGSYNLGDTEDYFSMNKVQAVNYLIPFHSSAQNLCYSYISAFEKFGIRITELNDLSPVVAGKLIKLLFEQGVITWKPRSFPSIKYNHHATVAVEMRACASVIYEMIATDVRMLLKQSRSQLPINKIVEQGCLPLADKIKHDNPELWASICCDIIFDPAIF